MTREIVDSPVRRWTVGALRAALHAGERRTRDRLASRLWTEMATPLARSTATHLSGLSNEDRRDAAIEAFRRAYDRIAGSDPVKEAGLVDAYVLTVSMRVCLETWRNEETRRAYETEAARQGKAVLGSGSTPEATHIAEKDRERVRSYRDRLPVQQAQILELHLGDRTNKEIARLLDSSENNVGIQLHRIREKIAAWEADEAGAGAEGAAQ